MSSALALEALAPGLHRKGTESRARGAQLINLGPTVVWLIIISGLVWQALFSCLG